MAEPTNGRGALLAGGLAAILASTCCLGPLVLLMLGVSGAWIANLTALEPFRPYFIGATVLATRRTLIEVREHRDEIEVRLSLGMTGRSALRPHLAEAMRTSIGPQIEQTKIVGIIAGSVM